MQMGSTFHHKFMLRTAILLFAVGILLNPITAFAGESKIIGYSNHYNATASSNGRKMVRTANDRRVVVYQDSVADKPVIRWTCSNDGFNWSPPAVMASGSFPALAVSDENWIYLVWCLDDQQGLGVAYSTDGATTWTPSIEIRPEAMAKSRFPAIEATTQAVHLVWQQEDLANAVEKISYQRFSKDLSQTLTPILTLSAKNFHSRFPVIAGDLEFKTEFMHLAWNEYPTTGDQPRIIYCNFIESAGPPNWGFITPVAVPGLSGKSHPSISVRNLNFSGNLTAQITLACIDAVNGRLITTFLHASPKGLQAIKIDSITAGPNSSTSADDVYLGSCAIVWQSNGNIYYGQTVDERIVTMPPIRVCNDTAAHCRNPNVCYKTFRRDSIDVVWTDGDHAPYRVMYRRMAKQYKPVTIDDMYRSKVLPRDFALLQNYPNPFWSAATSRAAGNPETKIRFALPQTRHVVLKIFNLLGKEIRTLLEAEYQAGYHQILWDGKDKSGKPVASGVYLYQLRVGDFSQIKKMSLLR